MEVRPHPRWPEENPQTLPQLQGHLISHFRFLFGDPKNVDDAHKLLAWLKADSPDILQLKGTGSFFTLFSSFHTGQPFMQKMLGEYVFPERLKAFLDVCTSLEKTTEQFAYLEKWEDLQYKEAIISDLERFINELPSQEDFIQLVESIREK